ncbi:hypothetical protein [Paenibacillus mesotrionivorans]|uniref:Uncharacterized protein n=1 Tax=Paenibacillus mesotrionivorans TaxID=3160968 RepID=A0ACC7NVT1_9BACL
MANGIYPSKRKREASDLQSKADRTGQGKARARAAQSETDQLDLKKH